MWLRQCQRNGCSETFNPLELNAGKKKRFCSEECAKLDNKSRIAAVRQLAEAKKKKPTPPECANCSILSEVERKHPGIVAALRAEQARKRRRSVVSIT